MSSMFRTRVSFGTQLRGALDDMVARGRLKSWCVLHDDRLGNRYQLVSAIHPGMSFADTPGKVADYLNAIGYDIRFGKEA